MIGVGDCAHTNSHTHTHACQGPEVSTWNSRGCCSASGERESERESERAARPQRLPPSAARSSRHAAGHAAPPAAVRDHRSRGGRVCSGVPFGGHSAELSCRRSPCVRPGPTPRTRGRRMTTAWRSARCMVRPTAVARAGPGGEGTGGSVPCDGWAGASVRVGRPGGAMISEEGTMMQ